MKVKERIKKWYIIFGIINLILSIISLYFISSEKVNLFSVINFGYHMMYFSISFLPRYQLRHVSSNKSVYKIAFYSMKIFSILAVVIGGLFTAILIFNSIDSNEYSMLFASFTPAGIILGGLSLKNYLTTLKINS